MEIIRKNEKKDPLLKCQNDVSFFQFKKMQEKEWLLHAFSTRLGGVSGDCFSTMNLGFGRGDSYKNVIKNYERFGDAVGFDWKKAVVSHQTHTTNIRLVTAKDAGKGILKDRDYEDIDGMITKEPGIALITFYADCVPLYFADIKHKAIGLSHSGWRGTVGRMGEKTLKAMREAFNTDPADVVAAIGPSICGDCFEVGPEVKEEFAREFNKEQMKKICHPGIGEKSYIDLWQANFEVLKEAGVASENISVTNVCTRCNPELLYSHRIMGAKRGNLAAVMMIR